MLFDEEYEQNMRKRQLDYTISEMDFLFKKLKELAKEDKLTQGDAEEALKFFHSRLEKMIVSE
jgi:hypothetical protein